MTTPPFQGTNIPCPVCRGTDLTTVSDADRHGGRLRTDLCRACGHVFTNPQPTQPELDAYYARAYRASYKKITAPKNKHVYRAGVRALERLDRLVPHIPESASIFDIGAGGGEFIYLLTQQGYRAKGVEPNVGYAEHARAAYGADILTGTVEQNFPAPGAWDAITLHHVLEHLASPVDVLRRLRTGLSDDGLLVVEVPNVEANYHAAWRRFHFAHLHNFSADGLTRAAASAGLAVTDLLVQPHTGHLNAILKPDEHAEVINDGGTAERIETQLRGASRWGDHLTVRPYRRLWANAIRPVREHMALIRMGRPDSARDLLDRLYTADNRIAD